jgi:hypothetical protein
VSCILRDQLHTPILQTLANHSQRRLLYPLTPRGRRLVSDETTEPLANVNATRTIRHSHRSFQLQRERRRTVLARKHTHCYTRSFQQFHGEFLVRPHSPYQRAPEFQQRGRGTCSRACPVRSMFVLRCECLTPVELLPQKAVLWPSISEQHK